MPAPADPVAVPRLAGEVALEHVRFRYLHAIDDALRGIDLHISRG